VFPRRYYPADYFAARYFGGGEESVLDLTPDGVEGDGELGTPALEYAGVSSGGGGGGGMSLRQVNRLIDQAVAAAEARVRAEMAVAPRTVTLPAPAAGVIAHAPATPSTTTSGTPGVIASVDLLAMEQRVLRRIEEHGRAPWPIDVSHETPNPVLEYPDLRDVVARQQREIDALTVLLMASVE
jgi:hypothetical protein